MAVRGPRGILPAVPFIPTRPQKPAGMRIDPPPSPPVASGTRPPATAAAEPAEDPPVVLVRSQGLPVTPWRRVTLTFRPPNSLAVVWPVSTAPAARRRLMTVASWVDTRSEKTRLASLSGQPSTGSSSLTPTGSPPSGAETSAPATLARAASASKWQKALSRLAPMADRVASSSSKGERSPARNESIREQASPCHGSVMAPTLRERAVAAHSAGEPRCPLRRLARPESVDPVAVLGHQRGLERQRPLLVRRQAIAAQAVLREGGQLAGQLQRRLPRLARLHRAVGQPHGQRLLPADRPPRQDQVQGPALADEPREAHGAAVDQGDSPAAAEHAEDGVACRHPQVAPQRQLEPACHRVTLDRGHHRLGQQHAGRPHGTVPLGQGT